ncbi:MAG TPA: tetratricopeptide repeat protein [Terriglobales bacterium]|jgi:tetratricopeptide (TPR) repeat protein
MSSTRKTTWVATSLLIACLAGSSLLLHKTDTLRSGSTLREVLYITSPREAKRISLGYDGLLADIYWTRAVQYFGSHHAQQAQEYKLLAPLLNITAALDPHLTVAYEFGSTFLSTKPPNGAGEPAEAVKLVEYGIENNPNDWHLYYNLGFIYYLELKDPAKAADAFSRGSKIPNAHPWLRVLAARMADNAGDEETARMMWSAAYQTSQDKNVRENAAAHLRAMDVDSTVPALETQVRRYTAINGHTPSSFMDLVSTGLLLQIPIDPTGKPYKLMPNGEVEVSVPEDLPFIKQGLPEGYTEKQNKFLPSD